MRFQEGGPEVPVRWYFCDDNAPLLPFPTRFASGNWSREKTGWKGVGEVEGAKRSYVKGERPMWATGKGLCGTPGRFAAGWAASESVPTLPRDETGAPICCGVPMPVGGMGVGLPIPEVG